MDLTQIVAAKEINDVESFGSVNQCTAQNQFKRFKLDDTCFKVKQSYQQLCVANNKVLLDVIRTANCQAPNTKIITEILFLSKHHQSTPIPTQASEQMLTGIIISTKTGSGRLQKKLLATAQDI